MGLDTSHDAFHGAYSAFNSLRQEVAHVVGGSYGPHWLRAYNGELARDKDGCLITDTAEHASSKAGDACDNGRAAK